MIIELGDKNEDNEPGKFAAVKYNLEDFSRPEYSDPVVPVQIMMVMMGFLILLLNGLSFEPPYFPLRFCALICGFVYFLFFMFYMTEYYEKLWEPYYLLPEDKLFFRFYCILVGIIIIFAMQKYPEHWPSYIILLFAIMWWKKRQTRDLFRDAVKARYGGYAKCDDGPTKSKYVLVEIFTLNFLVMGFWFLLPLAIVMSVSASLIMNEGYIELLNPYSPVELTVSGLTYTYITLSVVVTGVTSWFWYDKITKNLIEMKTQIEAGHYAYFEARDLRNSFRRGRHINRE